jgi:hypothetical protein
MARLVINYWLCQPRAKGIALLVGHTGRASFVTRCEHLVVPRLSPEDRSAKIELELKFRLQIVGQTSGFQFRAGGVFLRTCRTHRDAAVVGEGWAYKNKVRTRISVAYK